MAWTDVDLAEKLWSASYAVTAFATVQGITYLFALAGSEFRAKVQEASTLVSVLIVVCHIFYFVIILTCHVGVDYIAPEHYGHTAHTVNIAIGAIQTLAIVFVGALALMVTRTIAKNGRAA